MRPENWSSSRGRGLFLAGAVTLLLTSAACDSHRSDPPLTVQGGERANRDYAQIRQSGVLRMITEYSSGTYHINRGVQVGFEYDLVKEFANTHDLALEVIIPTAGESPYDLLNAGVGDIIASQYSISEERKQIVDFTRPYNLSDHILVFSSSLGTYPVSLEQVVERRIPISVRRNSAFYFTLRELQEAGLNLRIDLQPEEYTPERFMADLTTGVVKATVMHDHQFLVLSANYPDAIAGPVLTRQSQLAWAVRKGNPDLLSHLDRFLYSHFRLTDVPGQAKRSTLLGVLHNKYFGSKADLASIIGTNPLELNLEGTLSPFDALIRTVSDSVGVDWVMVTAIIAQESAFRPESKSWAGAVGLMQVIPRFSKETYENLYDPEKNLWEGARILREHLDHYSYMQDERERWSFALGTYNAGPGHIADARRLVIDQNKDPNKWENVADALLKMMQKRYYEHARYGYKRGIETVRYVVEIHNRADTYRRVLNPQTSLLTRNETRRSVPTPQSPGSTPRRP